MEPDKQEVPIVDDEAALDKEILDSINAVKAGKELAPNAPAKPEGEVEEKPVVEPAAEAEPKVEDPSEPPAAEVTEAPDEFRIPNKGKFESDESYAKRIELFDLVKQRRAATTPEAKAKLKEQIQNVKSQIKTLNPGSPSINNTNTVVDPKDEDPTVKADREKLKALGGVTKEDLQETIRKERFDAEQQSTLKSFVGNHKELADEDLRDMFFDYVDNNYNWQGKSGNDLMAVLELAVDNMFKPAETIQDRVLKGARVAEKVNTMQFPGGSSGKGADSPELRSSLDELKATGMSEEKARELLAD